MQLFYAPELSSTHRLPVDEAKHCIKILRHHAGDNITVTDGKGSFYTCELLDTSGNLKVISSEKQEPQSPYQLHFAIAPTKNGERTDWMLEKLVEFGIDEITFLNCDHNERDKINLERCERIAVSAMKQSVKSYMVKINPMVGFKQFITGVLADTKLLAHCNTNFPRTALNTLHVSGKVICCIGPEGDFSEQEIKFAMEKGFQGVSMGQSRLRTETAAIAACSYFYFKG